MKKKFTIPGMYHPITVKLVKKKTLKAPKGTTYLGDYNHIDAVIRLDKDRNYEVKRHTLYHEISHHIKDTLETMKDEEDHCDVLGGYLIRLIEAQKEIEEILK